MIRTEKYNVVLSGQLLDGMDLGRVKDSFKAKFKLKAEQVDRMFSGHSKVLKKGLDHKSAYHYKRIINELGAEVDIKRVIASPDHDSIFSLVETHEERHARVYEKSSASTPSATCPNCHSPRGIGSACMHCGALSDKNNHQLKPNTEIRSPLASARKRLPEQNKDENKTARRRNPNAFGPLKLLSYLCFAFCFLDLGYYFLDLGDLTGIAWSPFFAWSAGYLLSLIS